MIMCYFILRGQVEMEAPKYSYIFSLLTKISIHHFKLLDLLPFEVRVSLIYL